MGNSFGTYDGGPSMHLSNGGSEVFLDVLALAACELAESPFERGFALLLCNSRIGLGNESFDLCELPWSEEWVAERSFLLRVVQLAATGFRWGLLSYNPPYVADHLGEYEQLLVDFEPRQTGELARFWDPAPPAEAFRQCLEHGLFVGDYTDCRLCL
ncbi:hypothetical protein AB0E69_10300 [Kribbella sp. NPDC026611]|uniref:hypothetical protein n=1 Tax=Kribbella sp. NPDC026611 TaxID=3154911 RepID=UPI0033D77E80